MAYMSYTSIEQRSNNVLETPRQLSKESLGLCFDCAHAKTIHSARESAFTYCKLSESDPAFAKYPLLPVYSCGGYSRNSAFKEEH